MAGLRALRFDLYSLITVQHRHPGGELNGFVSQNGPFGKTEKWLSLVILTISGPWLYQPEFLPHL
jgi:hypothetical protein